MKHGLLSACLMFFLLANGSYAQNTTINGATQFQTIHSLGVNVNPHSWNINPGSVKKVVDSLITGMGCTSFRLMFDDTDWETVNDNNDPNLYNWTYYDSVYSAPRFTAVWSMVEYLNTKGISNITLCPVGATPGWMGGTKLPETEAEYGETIASMVFYGQKRRSPAIHFNMLSPINETGCWVPVWTELKLLEFLRARDEAEFTDINWKNNQLTFEIGPSLKHSNGLTCTVPYMYNEKKVSKITINGVAQSYSVKSIRGFDCAFVTIKPGFNYSLVVSY
jgi:hypothetical protein